MEAFIKNALSTGMVAVDDMIVEEFALTILPHPESSSS